MELPCGCVLERGTDGGPGHFLRAEALRRGCQSAQSLGLANYSAVAIFSLHGGHRSPGCVQKAILGNLEGGSCLSLALCQNDPLTLSSPTQLPKSLCVDGSGRLVVEERMCHPWELIPGLPRCQSSSQLQSLPYFGSSVAHTFHRTHQGHKEKHSLLSLYLAPKQG